MPLERPRPTSLITPRELPVWVPGEVLAASDGQGWKEVAQRTYRYRGQDVEIPPMETSMIVQYRRGVTPMDRQVEGRWTSTRCGPGNVSLLSRSAQSHWNWSDNVEVTHLYLANSLLARVAGELRQQEVAEVYLHDVLEGSDPVISHIADCLTEEARSPGAGGPLYVEALGLQLAVHLLRGYATCIAKEKLVIGALTAGQLSRLEDYVDAHLHETISIEDMAESLGLGAYTFVRQLRRRLDCSAYAYVIQRRLARAKRLLQQGDLALKEIAAASGFADQAHLTRTFRAKLGVTPGQYRKRL